MRKNFIYSGLIVVAALAAACSSDGEDDGSGGASTSNGGAGPTSTTTTSSTSTGDGGAGSTTSSSGGAGGTGEGGGDGGNGGGSTGDPGWTTLTLLEGEDSFHDSDSITAIYFSDLETGLVGTRGSGDVAALYKATATEITDFAVPEDTLTDPPGALGDYSVRGIVPTSDGIRVTLDTSGAILSSTDGFATFDLEDSGIDYGIAPLEALFETDEGYVALIGSGVVATSTEAPGPGVTWTETWAPEGIPTTPNPIPEGGCNYGPRTRITENLNQIGGITPDGQTVIYVTRSEEQDGIHVVCVSHDGGVSFEPRELAVGDEASAVGPTAAVMVSDTVGFVATSDFSSGDGGTATIWKTEDAGDTWTAATIPAVVNENVVLITTVFFAPGGDVGYAVGQFGSADGPLLLKTTDGGDTWVEPSGVGSLTAAMDAAGTFGRIYTGFALDEYNLWIGGDGSGLFYSNNGAED